MPMAQTGTNKVNRTDDYLAPQRKFNPGAPALDREVSDDRYRRTVIFELPSRKRSKRRGSDRPF